MIKNYLTLALKVLRRRPLYTFISLFGISFTLMILLLVTALGDASLGANPPMSQADRLVVVSMLERYTPRYDTTLTVDSTRLAGGGWRYDTTTDVSSTSRNTSQGGLGFHFADRYLRGLEGVSELSAFDSGNPVDAYLAGRKVSLMVTYADAAFWRVFDYQFLAGDAFRPEDVAGGNRVAVLTERAATEYFGESGPAVIGRELELERERYTVRGIVAPPPQRDELTGGDVFVPYTAYDPRILGDKNQLYGGFVAVFLAETPAARDHIGEQLDHLADNFVMPPGESYEKLGLTHGTALETFAMRTVGTTDADEAMWYLFLPVAVLLALFVVLPLLNLVNLGLSRISERAGEIAVRKAFGANGGDILRQFLLENLLLTAIGGVVGLGLAYLVVQYVNAAGLLGGTRLSLSGSVFGYALLIILVFGLLSGLWPAYRMSRTNIAGALR